MTNVYECLHERRELRSRIVAGGAIQYVMQCVECGHPSQAISHARVAMMGGKEPPPFDETLREEGYRAPSRATLNLFGTPKK